MKKENYLMLACSFALLLVGYCLMCGEGTDFHPFRGENYSPQRIRYAPLCCMAGYLFAGLSLFADRLKRRRSKVS